MWDEVNGSTTKFEQTAAILAEGMDQPEENEWEDEAMEVEDVFRESKLKVVEGVIVPNTAPASKLVVVDRITSAPPPDAADVEDEADKIT